jgi:glycosyltransferase-like protein
MTSIGLFTYSTKPRGSVVHACHLAEALSDRGHDVTLYALSKAGDRLYRELRCPVVYLPAGIAPPAPDALIAQRIGEISAGLADVRPRHDVYHAEDCLMASGLLQQRAALGLYPLVRTLHHLEAYESEYLRACQRRSIAEADAVACVSRASQRDVREALGRDCPIIGNGVDVERFAPDAELDGWARRRFGVLAGELVVLSVGGVEPRKNSHVALEAMARVLREHPTARWLIAGGASIWEHDAYRAAFRRRLTELEPSARQRVVELGPVSERELTGLYRISHALLCPSLQEGFGLCVLEAMAAGCPVIVSHAPPFTEYLPVDAAAFVDPRSGASIADALARLCTDAARRRRLAVGGVRIAASFSWQKVALEHEQLYRSLTSTSLHPRTATHEELAHA